MIKRIRAAFAAFFVVGTIVAVTPATAVPIICVMPTSGTVSGLTLVQDINNCYGAALGLFAGGSAPGSPTTGMLWWNTGTGFVQQWDGAAWINLWAIDATNHVVMPQVGGGITTVASASTTDLCANPASFLFLTGSVTITSFGSSCAVGTWKRLFVNTGAGPSPTLQYNGSTMVLPGLASIATAPADTFDAVYTSGGQWIVTNYQRSNGAALSTVGLNVGASALGASALGFNMPVNLGLTASTASNALTVSLVGANGAAPSSTNPVLIPFRSTTLATGTPGIDSVQGTVSMTVGSGFTMGCSSGLACRIWVYAIDNGGTVLLGLQTCASTTQIFSCGDDLLYNTNANNNGTNLNGVLASSTAGLSGKAVRLIGYLEVTETTAGTWATAPSKIQVFGPGVHKPGDVVQSVSLSTGGTSTQNTSGFLASNVSGTITPTSTINPIRVRITAAIVASANSGGNELIGTQVYRGISGSFTAIGQEYNTGLASPGAGSSYQGNVISLPSDLPGTTLPVTYTLYFNSAAPGHNVSVLNGEGELIEIMGALAPANDGAAPLRLVG